MRIVNCHGRSQTELEAIPGFVYCGRGSNWRRYFRKRSPLANPFPVNKHRTAHEAIALFEAWLHRERNGAAKEVWTALEQLPADAVLGCWCVNKERAGEGEDRCHCDVIARTWKALKTG